MDNGDLIKYNNQLYLVEGVEFDDNDEPISLFLQKGKGQIGGIAIEDCEKINIPDEDFPENTNVRFRISDNIGMLYQTLTSFNLKEQLTEFVFSKDYETFGIDGFEGFLIEKSYISLPDEIFINLDKLGL